MHHGRTLSDELRGANASSRFRAYSVTGVEVTNNPYYYIEGLGQDGYLLFSGGPATGKTTALKRFAKASPGDSTLLVQVKRLVLEASKLDTSLGKEVFECLSYLLQALTLGDRGV